jgi:threonine dehydrogenase-like Zn-dependent dehydrogenase
MKAVVYDAPARFALTEVPVPEPEPGEVRVAVQQTGICGTDLHIHNGKFFAEFPLTPGHELVGPVDALGDGVREITIRESFAEINAFPAAIAALRSGRIRTEGLITHRFKLDEYAEALEALRHDRTVHKVIVECAPRAC